MMSARGFLARSTCIAAALLLSGAAPYAGFAATSGPSPRFNLSSPDALLQSRLPQRYAANAFGCTGGNSSPPLAWTGAPPNTRSFVLTLFDRDERSTPSGWWHWIVYDLPASAASLSAGAGRLHSTALPPGSLQGRSDLGEDAYHGPCPATGDPPHRYVFTLYALDVAKLDVPADSSGAMVVSVAQEHVLATAVFVARHGR